MAYNNLVQSVLRGMDIILETGKSDRGMTLRELSSSLNLKVPTLHNLLRTLKARGFIRQCPGEARYVLGATLFDLTALNCESRLMTEAEKTVRSLFDEMQQAATIVFSEQIGGEMQTILRMSPDQPAVMQKPKQRILDPYTTATALVLHAFGSDEDRATVQARYPFQECAGPFVNNLEQFNKLVKQVRKQGYAFNPVCYPDRFSVTVPVLDGRKRLLGIIGLSRQNPAPEKIQDSIKQEALSKILNAARKLSELFILLTGNNPEKRKQTSIRKAVKS